MRPDFAFAPRGAAEILEISRLANQVLFQAHNLLEEVAEVSSSRLAALCGLNLREAARLSDVLNLAHDAAHVLNNAIVGVRGILACETFHPIYSTFVHKAFCVQGVGGLTTIFATTLVISIFSMCMIMFRAALYPVKDPLSASLALSGEDAVEVTKDVNESPGNEAVKDSEEPS